ncbi:N-acetylmuramoyl-L-alanine amidase [Algoriphagus ratkowskyi]|uniref:N-acetylmuramoyl-L-alanine amidase n=1 Tax=Algoriphagus ratkowskyi TaxID=57028 RepID=A0A2W7R2Q4_9BACT|nr:peptidoglycan recognition family protein [Algoriphagus ratkowskyi]PZX53486.1 N-acetylmuramoyl-L-alanine amidase [Algoriphagus ratkowskyi]TXD76480.1 N-acetylmuramoyl-L-alanine amidase [Algoriphagus ratkowskyi]
MKFKSLNTILTLLAFFILSVLQSSCSSKSTFRIIDKPITWNQEREDLSLDYLKERHGLVQKTASIDPKIVVVHWTAIDNIELTFDVFNPPTLEGRADLTGASNLNVSSQFLIDRDGTIFRLLPDTTFARHTIGLNYLAIGIENIGSDDMPLTKNQLKANEELIRYLERKYAIDYVIGHHEYQNFQSTDLWKEANPDYRTVKTDPGDSFMKKLRKNLSDLNLKPLPTL